MKQLRILPFFLALAGLLPAGTVITSFPLSTQNSTWFIDNGDSTHVLGAGFTMPAVGSYSLDSARVALDIRDQANPPVNFGLFADSAGIPNGSALVTFVVPPLPSGGFGPFTLTPSSGFTLLPSTTYWLVAQGVGTGAAVLGWIGDTTAVGTSGIASSAGYYDSFSLGSTQNIIRGGDLEFEVDGTLQGSAGTPEPGTIILLGAGLLTIWIRRR